MKDYTEHKAGTLIQPYADSFLYEEEDNMFLMLLGTGELWTVDRQALTLGNVSNDGKFFDILLDGRILWVRSDRSYSMVTQ